MKKLLAVVLTLAMLVSCFAIVASAAQQVRTFTENKVTSKYYDYAQGQSWCPFDVGTNSNTLQMDVRLNDGNSSYGCYGLNGGKGIYFSASQIGLECAKVSCTIPVGEWTTLKWVRTSGQTEMFVNGASVGTVNAELTYYTDEGGFKVYGNPVLVSIDNIVADNYSEDFEDGTFNSMSGAQGIVITDEEVTEVYTNDLKYDVALDSDKIMCFGDRDGAAANYYMAWQVAPTLGAARNAAYTRFDYEVRADASLSYAQDWLGGAPAMDAAQGKIGVGGALLSFDWTVGQWYAVSMICHNNVTDIYVDGTWIGAVDGKPLSGDTYWCGPQQFVSYNNFKYYTSDTGADDAWTLAYENDFDAMTLQNDDGAVSGTGPSSAAGGWWGTNAATTAIDLGMKYYYFQSGNSYQPVTVGNLGTHPNASVDIKLDTVNSAMLGWEGLYTGFQVTADGIGIGEGADATLVLCSLTPETWYHVEWIWENDAYTIKLDGAVIGTVAREVSFYDGNTLFASWQTVSIDNLVVGTYSDDFEGNETFIKGNQSEQGTKMSYDFSDLKKTIPEILHGDNYDAATAAAGSTADVIAIDKDSTIQNGSNNACWYYNGSAIDAGDVVIDFNLALIASTDDRTNSTEPYFDVWLNSGCNYRFIVTQTSIGESKGGADDLVAFNWGDATAENVRNIILVIKSSYNKFTVYVDGVEAYSTALGCNYKSMLGWLGFIGQNKNCAAQISNYAIYDLDLNPIAQNMSDISGNGGYPKFSKRVVGEACETAGHVYGSRVTTTATTCYSNGQYSIACAYCGAENIATGSIAKSEHHYSHYSKGAVDEATGLAVVYCANEGCPSKFYTENLEEGTYTGTYTLNWDFRDELYQVANGDNRTFGYFAYDKDAGALYADMSGNYNENHFVGDARPDWHDYSISFDFTVTNIVDRDEGVYDPTTGITYRSYGRTFYIWTGGSNGITRQIGVDLDSNSTIYLRDRMEAMDDTPIIETPFQLNLGETYNLKMAYYVDDDEYTAGIYTYLNGELMWKYDSDDNPDLYFDCAYAAGADGNLLDWWVLRYFNCNFYLDNLTMGNGAFARTDREYNGDADGDYAITAADATAIRLVLSGNADSVPCGYRADANHDGKLTAKDLLLVRLALVG